MNTVLRLSVVLLALGGLVADEPRPTAPSTQPSPSTSTTTATPKPTATRTRNLGVEPFDKLRMGTNVVILDVRTPAEFAEGHLPGAVLIDFRAPDFVERVAKLDKSKQYLVHCAAGGRSARACAKLETLGFTNLVNLEGGLNAWKGAGKPVTK